MVSSLPLSHFRDCCRSTCTCRWKPSRSRPMRTRHLHANGTGRPRAPGAQTEWLELELGNSAPTLPSRRSPRNPKDTASVAGHPPWAGAPSCFAFHASRVASRMASATYADESYRRVSHRLPCGRSVGHYLHPSVRRGPFIAAPYLCRDAAIELFGKTVYPAQFSRCRHGIGRYGKS